MPTRQKPFAETGAASNFVDLWENGSGFRGSEDQRKMTPFQRQVIAAARAEEARQQEQRREEIQQEAGGGTQRPRNSRSSGSPGGSSGLGQEETVRYINREENPDHEVH